MKNFIMVFRRFLPFYVFVFFFKLAASLHYTILSPLGEKFFPVWIVGLLIGFATFGQLILDIPAGKILDKYGYKRLLQVGVLFFIATISVFFFGITSKTYIITLILSVFGWLFFTPGVNAYLLAMESKIDDGKIVSIKDISGSVAVVLSSGFLTYFLSRSDFFLGSFFFVSLMISFLFLYFVPKEKNIITKIKTYSKGQNFVVKRNSIRELLAVIKKLNPASTMLLLTGFSSSLFYAIIWFVIPLEISSGISDGLPSFSLGIFDFSIVVFGFILGNIADKYNKRTITFWGLLLFALCGIFIGFSLNVFFILFGFLATIGEELSTISLWSWLHGLDKDHANDGAVGGVITFMQDLGWAIGPMFAGFLYTKIGATFTIFIGGLVLTLVFVFYYIFMKKYNINTMLKYPKKPHFKRYKH